MNTPENNIVTVQVSKEITHLFKDFLEVLEDLKKDNDIMLSKIPDKQLAENINYFTQEKYEQLRKRILDKGNTINRETLAFLEFFEFIINKEKVEAAANQRRIVKKFITSAPVVIK